MQYNSAGGCAAECNLQQPWFPAHASLNVVHSKQTGACTMPDHLRTIKPFGIKHPACHTTPSAWTRCYCFCHLLPPLVLPPAAPLPPKCTLHLNPCLGSCLEHVGPRGASPSPWIRTTASATSCTPRNIFLLTRCFQSAPSTPICT